jgi:hypothetical protein
MKDEQMLREVYDSLHASAQTRQEVLNMNKTNETRHFAGKRVLVAALAVVLALALAVGAMAAAGVFRMNIREADPAESFAGPTGSDINGNPATYHWEGAKLVFSFEGTDTCNRIRFTPTYMPYTPNSYFSFLNDDGSYSRISCEGTSGGGRSNQPCLIEVRYAPMFTDGGSLLLLYADDTSDIVEEEWNGHRILKFGSHRANPNFPGGEHDTNACYYIMYQPEQGYILTLSSFEGNLDTLEQIAKSLEIEPTAETVSSADWHEHNEFMDCGVG